MPRLLLTGAAGRVGRMVRPFLVAAGFELTCLDVAADDDPDVVAVDLFDADALRRAMDGCDAVAHLAGNPGEGPLAEVLRANVEGTNAVLDAAQRSGIRRVVLASSNHAVGFWERDAGGAPLPSDVPVRPDTFYGVSKVGVEALGQLYADRFGMGVVSLRIGSCRTEPSEPRELATWLSPGDAARLIAAAATGLVDGHVIAYGVSANARGWWDLTTARGFGYQPQDDAEVFADRMSPVPPSDGSPAAGPLGGGFTRRPLGVPDSEL